VSTLHEKIFKRKGRLFGSKSSSEEEWGLLGRSTKLPATRVGWVGGVKKKDRIPSLKKGATWAKGKKRKWREEEERKISIQVPSKHKNQKNAQALYLCVSGEGIREEETKVLSGTNTGVINYSTINGERKGNVGVLPGDAQFEKRPYLTAVEGKFDKLWGKRGKTLASLCRKIEEHGWDRKSMIIGVAVVRETVGLQGGERVRPSSEPTAGRHAGGKMQDRPRTVEIEGKGGHTY